MKKMVLFVCFAFFLPSVVSAAGWKEIAPKQVYGLLKEGSGLWLIDVRAPASFEKEHVEGSVNIPESVLAVKTFPPQKILVLVDSSLGQLQAREAAEALVKRKQKRVFVLSGGLQGWRREGLPVIGAADGWELARLMPGELRRALAAEVAVEVYDLREQDEALRGPVAGSFALPGKSLAEKIDKLRKSLAKKGKKELAARLEEPRPVVVVVPAAADARALYQRYLWNLPGEVRVLEGGHAAWNAQRGRLTISNVEGCPTCPGN